MIHPTAIIDDRAELDSSVEVGPYAIIDGDVTVGPDCRIGPQVHLTGHTSIGAGNRFHTGCVIGDAPQDLRYRDEPTRLVIGDHNIIREHVTLHRSNSQEEETRIGSHNYLMAHAHVGHNSQLGDHVILANGTLLAGHVTIFDHAILSGNVVVHQFTRIGEYVMVQGKAGLGMDVPPFCMAAGTNRICGLNTVGLRRAGFNLEVRSELKRLYRDLFRMERPLTEAVAQARQDYSGQEALHLLDFIESSKRGVCPDRSRGAA